MSESQGAALTRVLLVSCGAWYLRQTGRAFHSRSALAGLWISDKNSTEIPAPLYRRCWPFHLCMKPFYHFAPQIITERAFYSFFPLWKAWLALQNAPHCNVVHAISGYGTEPFDHADKIGALKVIDCPNSHPTTLHKIWQRECDLWCSGEKVPIPEWMFARMNRELERADLILCPSFFVRDTMLLNGIPERKCFVNPFGVDLSIFKPQAAAPDKIRFVCVGTICLRKGHQYLFRAWEIVKRELPEAELICVGDYKSDFRKERPKWEHTFRQIPSLRHQELESLLARSTAFVFPSQEEGFARVQIEAMACALPIIGTHEAGATTMVEHGIEGLIVRGRDPEHIAAAMIRRGRDYDLNQRMRQAAYNKVATHSSWQQYGDRLLEHDFEVLQERRATTV